MAELTGATAEVLGSFLSGTEILLIVILGVGSLGLILMALLHILKYKIRVEIEEQYGNNIIESATRGGIILDRKSKVKQLEIWKTHTNPFQKLVGPVPTNDYFRQGEKGKQILRIYKDSEDSYKIIPPNTFWDKINPVKKERFALEGETAVITPIKPVNPKKVEEKPVDLDWLNWGTLSLKGKAERFRKDPGFMEKYGTLMGLGMVSVIMIFMVIYGFNNFGDMSGNIARAASANAETAKSLERAQAATAGIQSVVAEGGAIPHPQPIQGGGG